VVEAERSARLGALNAELAQLRSTATTEIEAALGAARASFGDAVADLAVAAASKVVAKPVDRAAALPLVNEYVTSSGAVR
jgi:F0F1-type ATP synthase membrane subunit b/b'